MNKVRLERELEGVLNDINNTIFAIQTDCADWDNFDIHKLKDTAGNYIAIPLFFAKAQALNGLAVLRASEKK